MSHIRHTDAVVDLTGRAIEVGDFIIYALGVNNGTANGNLAFYYVDSIDRSAIDNFPSHDDVTLTVTPIPGSQLTWDDRVSTRRRRITYPERCLNITGQDQFIASLLRHFTAVYAARTTDLSSGDADA